MDSIKTIVTILEKSIVKLDNIISQVNTSSSLEQLSILFNEDNIWNLSSSDIEKVNKVLTGNNRLTKEEMSFLNSFVNMPETIKQTKKTIVGLTKEQNELIKQVYLKIKSFRDNFQEYDIKSIEEKIYQYKTLLSKFKQNDMNLITEIDLISQLLKENSIPFEEQMLIYEQINNINSNIFKKHNLLIEEEEVLSEDNLKQTNLENEVLKELFGEFHIDWKKDASKEKQEKIEQFYSKLLKYGDYEMMRKKLLFLRENNLEFVFKLPEILTKILLFSPIEKMQELLECSKKYGIDFVLLLKDKPTFLFPTLVERNMVMNRDGGWGSASNTSGLLNNFINCVQFLEENNYSVEEVYKECPSFFTKPVRTIKRVYQRLQMYGISFKTEDGKLKKGFSVLGTNDILDKLDIGIECGCYEYYQSCISKLVDPNLNLYRVKLARSKSVPKEDIFGIYNGYKGYNKIYLRNQFSNKDDQVYGQKPEDTFELYNAYSERNEEIELLNNMLSISENDSITDITLKNNVIEQLDQLYKVSEDDKLYDFNGIIISRYKVLRYFETLITNPTITMSKNLLMCVVTRHSMLNEDEYRIIDECIEKIKFKRRTLL